MGCGVSSEGIVTPQSKNYGGQNGKNHVNQPQMMGSNGVNQTNGFSNHGSSNGFDRKESFESINSQFQHFHSEVYYKDRHFIIPLSKLPPVSSNQRTAKLSKWFQEVVNTSISIAFNYLREEKLEYYAMKYFICQNIIRNLINASYTNEKFEREDISALDKVVCEKILPLIQVKFPVGSKQVNPQFSSIFQEIDNYDTKEHDEIINSSITFDYRSNGKYEDLIMKFLNQMVELPNKKIFQTDHLDSKNTNDKTTKSSDRVKSNTEGERQKEKLIDNYEVFLDEEEQVDNSQTDSQKNPKSEKPLSSGNEPKKPIMAVKSDSKQTANQTKAQNQNKKPQGNKQQKSSGQKTKTKYSNTLFKHFQHIMNKIVQQVYDLKIMDQNNKKEEFKGQGFAKTYTEQQKQKYKEQVKSYTTFQINSKIPFGEKMFDENSIRTQQIKDTSVSIMRVMTKWVEELQKKFKDKEYFMNLAENPVNVEKKQTYPFSFSKKLYIQKQFIKEYDVIKKDLKKFRQANQQLQTKLLNDTKNIRIPYVSDFQLQEAYFSGRALSCLLKSLSKYLNRLIHGLASVSKTITQVVRKGDPDILFTTFKIGDLIRCRFKSKQKEVIHVYKILQKISQQSPEKLKIIRLKNRLNQETNDILMNIRFYNLITVEVQMGIASNQKKFIKDSYEMKHTLYELRRASFGVISEFCSMMYSANNERAQLIQSSIAECLQQRKEQARKSQSCKHKLQTQTQTFFCEQCFQLIKSNQHVIDNSKCNKCGKYYCGNCLIYHMEQDQLKQKILEDKTLIDSCQKWDDKNSKFGIAIYKFSRSKIINAFQFVQFQTGQKIITRKQGSPQPPLLLKSTFQEFKNSNILWSIKETSNAKSKAKQIFKEFYFSEIGAKDKILKHCILPDYLKKCCLKEKQRINLESYDLTDDELLKLVENAKWTKSYKEQVENINLQKNRLTKIEKIFEIAPNVTFLTLDQNFIKQIYLPEKSKLQKLSIKRNNKIQFNISQAQSQYKSLKELSFGFLYEKSPLQKRASSKEIQPQKKEVIQSKIPEDIKKFPQLKKLIVMCNGIKLLPPQLMDLKQLEQINLSHNCLKMFPKELLYLKKLKVLILNNNLLQIIPGQIKELTNLTDLNVDENQIKTLPQEISLLKNISTISIRCNQLQESHGQALKTVNHSIDLSQNRIQNLNKFINPNISELIMQECELSEISPQSQTQMKNITYLSLSGNHFAKTPAISFGNHFQKLSKLNLSNCKIEQFFYPTIQFPSLSVLKLEHNNLKEIKPQIKLFKNLSQLFIHGNPNLKIIPRELLNLKKLIFLTLHNKEPQESSKILLVLDQKSLQVHQGLSRYSWLKIQYIKEFKNK